MDIVEEIMELIEKIRELDGLASGVWKTALGNNWPVDYEEIAKCEIEIKTKIYGIIECTN